MEKELTDTGIKIVGEVEWGSHFCFFYRNKNDMKEILVPYFKSGLENNEYCMWVTSEPLEAGEAEKALRKAVPELDKYIAGKQIEIISYDKWYLENGEFDEERVLKGWSSKLESALEKGFKGLRLTGNTFWLEENKFEAFSHYEHSINSAIEGKRIIALCSYAVKKCDAQQIIEVISSHDFSLIKNEEWKVNRNEKSLKTEEKLKETEDRYKLITESSPIGIGIVEEETEKFLYFNEVYKKVFGYSEEELYAKDSKELYYNSKEREEIKERLTESGECTYEINGKRKDGSKFWAITTIKRITYNGKRAIIGIIKDITERKRAEERLIESEKKYRHLLEYAPTAIYEIDYKTKKFISFNEALSKLTGYSYEELNDMDATEMLDEASKQKFFQRINDIYTGKKVDEDVEYRCKIKTGKELWVVLHVKLIYNNDKTVNSALVVGYDITERKKMEERLKKSEENFRTLFKYLPIATTIFEKEGEDYVITNYNEATEKFSNNQMDKFKGKKASEIYKDFPDILELFKHASKEKPFQKYQNYYTKQSTGERIYMSINLGYIPEGRIIMHTEDLTEMKRQEELIKENEQRLKHHLENTPLGVVELNRDMNFSYLSKEAERILGWQKEELIGKNHREFNIISATYLKETENYIKSLINKEGKSNIFINKNIRKDGKEIDCKWYNSIITDEKGEVVSLLSMLEDITERSKAEKELQISQQRLNYHLENSPLALIEWDSEFTITQWSIKAKEIFGWEKEEIIGKKLYDIDWVFEEDINIVSKTVEKLSSGKKRIVVSTNRNKRKDGKIIKCVWYNSVLSDKEGRMISVMSLVDDITESEESARALEESERKFSIIFDKAPFAATLTDLETRCIIIANEVFVKTVGYSKDDIIDNPNFISKINPKSETTKQMIKEVLEKGFIRNREMTLYNKNRNEINVLFNIDLLNINNRKYALNTIINITEQNQIREALKTSEEKYKDLVEKARTIILKQDTKGIITYINEFGQDFFGYKEDEILGKTGFETIVPEKESTGREIKDLIDNIFMNPDDYALNINENVKKSGERVWIAWHNKAIFDNTGKRVGHIAIGTDITERIQLEEELKRKNKRLEILSLTSRDLLSSENPQEIINNLCKRVMDFLDCQVFFNFLSKDGERQLKLNAYYGIPKEEAEKITFLEYGVAVCGCVAKNGERMIQEDIQHGKDPRTFLIKSYGIKAYACHPLKSLKNVIGTLSFGTTRRERFNEEEIEMMRAVADLVSIALNRIKNEEKLLRQTKMLEHAPILVKDTDDKIILWNKGMERLYGFKQEEARGSDRKELS